MTLTARTSALIRDVPDHPTPGILFKDITPLLADPEAFAEVVHALAAVGGDRTTAVDVVVGIEARGFILGAPVAVELGVGFVPMRKVGKLPHRTASASYALEYGQAELEVHLDGLAAGQRVLVVDDVLATGGTAAAACTLVEQLGATVAGIAVLLELTFLQGRVAVGERPLRALLRA